MARSLSLFVLKGKNVIDSAVQNTSLLLCEPDDGLRESLSMVLKSLYKTNSVSHTDQVLAGLSKFNSDLLILDIDLGEKKILNLYEDIKNLSPNSKIISLYVFDKKAKNIDSRIRKLSNAVLYKPLDINHFLETVKRVNNELLLE